MVDLASQRLRSVLALTLLLNIGSCSLSPSYRTFFSNSLGPLAMAPHALSWRSLYSNLPEAYGAMHHLADIDLDGVVTPCELYATLDRFRFDFSEGYFVATHNEDLSACN